MKSSTKIPTLSHDVRSILNSLKKLEERIADQEETTSTIKRRNQENPPDNEGKAIEHFQNFSENVDELICDKEELINELTKLNKRMRECTKTTENLLKGEMKQIQELKIIYNNSCYSELDLHKSVSDKSGKKKKFERSQISIQNHICNIHQSTFESYECFCSDKQIQQIVNNKKLLEDWSGKLLTDVVYDSSTDTKQTNKSFHEWIVNKEESLYFFVVDEYENIFGGYVETTIKKDNPTNTFYGTDSHPRYVVTDPNCYIFSLYRSTSQIQPRKFMIKQEHKQDAFSFWENENHLFEFGQDIVIFKFKDDRSWCSQAYFNYGEGKKVLNGTSHEKRFGIKRILVISAKTRE
ncbi:TLDc domain-containing protein [Entamoeba marina]